MTAGGAALTLAAELGRIAADIERELLRRCDRQDARLLEMSDKLAEAEKTITSLTRRLQVAEKRASEAAIPSRSRLLAVRGLA